MSGLRKILILVIVLCACNSCMLMGSLITSAKQEKETLVSWKDAGYKSKIQKRTDQSGTFYYHCRIKEKRMGGIYYRTILRTYFPKEEYEACLIKFPVDGGNLELDVCKKRTVKIKNKSN